MRDEIRPRLAGGTSQTHIKQDTSVLQASCLRPAEQAASEKAGRKLPAPPWSRGGLGGGEGVLGRRPAGT